MKKKYEVWVYNNYHFMDEDERYLFGRFESQEDSEKAARRTVQRLVVCGAAL